jgi:hypothetical protein
MVKMKNPNWRCGDMKHNMSRRSQNTLTTLQRYVQSFMKYDAEKKKET